MAELRLEGRGLAIVGGFSPAVLHPGWFAEHELIRDDEGGRADVKIVSPELSAWDLPWLNVQVSQQRLDLVCDDPVAYEAVRDLAVGTMRVLRGTRVAAMGMNYYFHYALDGMPAVLNRFVGLDDAEAWSVSREPTAAQLRVISKRPEEMLPDYEGSFNVDVQPSVRIKAGLFLGLNDHYDFKAFRPADLDARVQRLLTEGWDASGEYARRVADALVTDAEARNG